MYGWIKISGQEQPSPGLGDANRSLYQGRKNHPDIFIGAPLDTPLCALGYVTQNLAYIGWLIASQDPRRSSRLTVIGMAAAKGHWPDMICDL